MATEAENEKEETQSKKEPLPKLAYSAKETAKILGCGYMTVLRLIERGLLRSSGAMRNKMIPRTEIDRFLKTTLQ